MSDRDNTIKAIREGLNRRSRIKWSVTGGRGTAWGWIHVDAPPRLRTAHSVKDPGAPDMPESYYEVDTGIPGGFTPKAIRDVLARLLGLDTTHFQGVSIPAGNDYYHEYRDRAEGRAPSVEGVPYWD